MQKAMVTAAEPKDIDRARIVVMMRLDTLIVATLDLARHARDQGIAEGALHARASPWRQRVARLPCLPGSALLGALLGRPRRARLCPTVPHARRAIAPPPIFRGAAALLGQELIDRFDAPARPA